MPEISVKSLLAVDCSLRVTGVAVSVGGDIVYCESADLGRRQAAELPLMAERALRNSCLTFNDIGMIVSVCGPGYFTGIRVGCAYAAALAYGLNIPILPVLSTELLAGSYAGGEQKARTPLLCAVYAGHGSVYAASYGCTDDLPVGEYDGDALMTWLHEHDNEHNGVTVISDDADRAAKAVNLDIPITTVRPDVRAAAALAARRGSEAVLPAEFRAVYCKKAL